MPIKLLVARQIFDAIGNPTIEVDLVTELGLFRTSVPNTDKKLHGEMTQLKDHTLPEHHGLGVTQAINNINTIIAPELIKQNLEVTNQKEIDKFLVILDGTETKCRLGANAMMVVSMSMAKAAAAKKGIPLYRHISDLASVSSIIIPVPHFVMISGGAASSNNLPYLEYSVIPTGASSFHEAYRLGTEIYRELKIVLELKFGRSAIFVSENGGLNAPLQNHRECLLFMSGVIKKLQYEKLVEFAINACATDMFKDGSYDLDFKNPNSNAADYYIWEKLAESYLDNCKEFGLISVEDPFHNDDWSAWAQLNGRTGVQLIGNELTQCNMKRCQLAVEQKAINACALKLNQTGTLTEMIDVFKYMKSNGINVVVEDRVGDTDDLFLADLAVGLATGQVKFGAPNRGERVGKYNQILRIEEELGALSKFAGKNFRTAANQR